MSVIGSKSSPDAPWLSVVWNSPRAWLTSWATVSPTTSGPQEVLKALAQPAVLWRSPEETSAPPAMVPLKVETPGMAPSYPMSLVPLGALGSVISIDEEEGHRRCRAGPG